MERPIRARRQYCQTKTLQAVKHTQNNDAETTKKARIDHENAVFGFVVRSGHAAEAEDGHMDDELIDGFECGVCSKRGGKIPPIASV